MTGRRFEVAIDANDPGRLRRFWAVALNYREHTTAEGAVDLIDPAQQGPIVWFQQVPERRTTAKNRLHLDIMVPADERAALTEQLVALGGTVAATHQGFTVMADPEGNELCLTDSEPR
ncbi:VOC family protein [Natronosporangium hydrolyticum]|nr:VOC family protein [Natronosporangium hydrolyticum]